MSLVPRPSLGWLGYYLFGKSWMRMTVMMACLAAVSVLLLQRSKESLHLTFIRPSHLPRPIIILPLPDHDYLNAFDACAVESANQTKNSPVYVYVWSSNIGPKDYWTKFIAKMEGIKLAYMDINKVLRSSPIYGMFMNGGWGGKPSWAVWMATGGALLWNTGGILVPNSVLMTSNLELEIFGVDSGLLVAGKNRIHSIALGNTPQHPLTGSILEQIQEFNAKIDHPVIYDDEGDFTPLENILTNSVKEICNIKSAQFLKESYCGLMKIFEGSSDIWDFEMDTQAPKMFSERKFLHYTGDNNPMLHDFRRIRKLFENYEFGRYCPMVYERVRKLTEEL